MLLTNCARHHIQEAKKTEPKTPVRVSVSQRMGEFNKVKVTGTIDVYLHTGARSNKIVLQGEAEDVANVERGINNSELYINLGKGYPKYGHIKVDIYTHNIIAFTYQGSGNIFAKGVNAKCIDLDIDNDKTTSFDRSFGVSRAKFTNIGYSKIYGINSCVTHLILMDQAKVKLDGYPNLASLSMSGNSELTISRVKSKTLRTRLKGNARAKISGVTETLHAELWDKSSLNSRRLISQNSFVKTHNIATAYITAIKNQHTLAKDRSNIYYYFLPETKTNFMAKDGSVLDMREWPNHFKSYTPYNAEP